MELSWEKFQAAYLQAAPEIKEIIDNNRIPEAIEPIAQDLVLSSEQQKNIIAIFTYYFLSIVREADCLEELSRATDLNITTVGEQIFKPLKRTFMKEQQPVAMSAVPAAPTATSQLSEEIKEVETMVRVVSPIRTMTTDSQVGYHSTEEKVHQSDQSHLFQK